LTSKNSEFDIDLILAVAAGLDARQKETKKRDKKVFFGNSQPQLAPLSFEVVVPTSASYANHDATSSPSSHRFLPRQGRKRNRARN
jgi:hypothetical protein